MGNDFCFTDIGSLARRKPDAVAILKGSVSYPAIHGKVLLYQTNQGVIVRAAAAGLPKSDNGCNESIFAFHIHSGSSCTGTAEDPFANAKAHYNPLACDHPRHAGDLPPLFGVNGKAFSVFLTNRFTVREVIGKTVLVHARPDDFTSQPSGNAGAKIACGQIIATR